MEINNKNSEELIKLKERIQKLIKYGEGLGERSKSVLKLLYQQLYELIELERLERLPEHFLEAYLLWKGLTRVNYQEKHLKLAPNTKEKLMMIIDKELMLIEDRNQRQLSDELTDEELIKQLSLRLKSGRIKRDWSSREGDEVYGGSQVLYIEDKDHPENTETFTKRSMLMSLYDGEIIDFKNKEKEE